MAWNRAVDVGPPEQLFFHLPSHCGTDLCVDSVVGERLVEALRDDCQLMCGVEDMPGPLLHQENVVRRAAIPIRWSRDRTQRGHAPCAQAARHVEYRAEVRKIPVTKRQRSRPGCDFANHCVEKLTLEQVHGQRVVHKPRQPHRATYDTLPNVKAQQPVDRRISESHVQSDRLDEPAHGVLRGEIIDFRRMTRRRAHQHQPVMRGRQWTREIKPFRSSDNAGRDVSATVTDSVRTEALDIPIPVIVRQRARYSAPARPRSPTVPVVKCPLIQRPEPGHHLPPARPRRPPGVPVQPVESHLDVGARTINLGPDIGIVIDQLPKLLLRLAQKPSQPRSEIRQRSVIASLPPNHRRPVDAQRRSQALLRVARSLARSGQRRPAAHTIHFATSPQLSSVITISKLPLIPQANGRSATFPPRNLHVPALCGPDPNRFGGTQHPAPGQHEPQLAILHTAVDRAPRPSPVPGAPMEFTGRRVLGRRCPNALPSSRTAR